MSAPTPDEFAPFLPWPGMAPDPGGALARAEVVTVVVEHPDTPVQHSPPTAWSQGTPYPGPPATVNHYVDYQSLRWWGRTGQGQLVWSGETEFAMDLPPLIPADMAQHVDVWSFYMGGYPSIGRHRPTAYGDNVPLLHALYPDPSSTAAPGPLKRLFKRRRQAK